MVNMLADQAMSPEYFLKVWSNLAHCGLSYDYFCEGAPKNGLYYVAGPIVKQYKLNFVRLKN